MVALRMGMLGVVLPWLLGVDGRVGVIGGLR
jgi:hypothetical protein